MMPKPTSALVFKRLSASLVQFRDDEGGAMALFIIFMFLMMITFGGIAVDVMRFETRRVAMQQTLDRAALAAASLTQTRTPQSVVDDWFAKAGLGDSLYMVDFEDPSVAAIADAGLRRVTVSASVTSKNYFMGIFSPTDYLSAPTVTEAAQGVSQIEVMLVLDITGSMSNSIGGGKTKVQALREAADNFVNIVKSNDTKNGVSIGIVPYAAQVNIPAALRAQFNATNISTWNGVANAGVPYINCFEMPTSDYDETALSLTDPIRMAAVADTNSATTTSNVFLSPADFGPVDRTRICTTKPDDAGTALDEREDNHLMLPTKDGTAVRGRIARLTADGNTSIALGMRWGVAMLDEEARPIYTAIGDASVQGRPADNDSTQTRKIIILMTDGEHVSNNHIKDAYKTGPSPIWRGTDGNFAIRFTNGGPARTNGTRPTNCSGWPIDTNLRQFFVPHLKDDSEKLRVNALELEGRGTGTLTTLTNTTCDPNSWLAAPTWPLTHPTDRDADGERIIITGPDGPDADTLPDPIMVTATQLDWSEVWRYVRVSWVVRQLYMRSAVNGTGNYNTMMDEFRQTYLSVSNMNSLLQQNCAAARDAGIEIYGIAFAAPANGQSQINGCSSSPKDNYYFNATDNDKLMAAFNAIAVDISELRLTQ
jgi:Flp pilus assembly protein TadG